MNGRFAILLGMLLLALGLGLGASPVMAAELCTTVWEPGAGNSGLNNYVSSSGLDLPSFTGTVSLTSQNPRSVPTGDSHWSGGSSSNGWQLSVSGTGTAQVFVNGSLSLGNNAVLSAPSGNPEDLVLVVNGSLTTGNNVVINGFVYVTGSASIGNNFTLSGALSTGGALSVGNNDDTTYVDPENSSFGGLCDPPPEPLTCLADNFNRTTLGADWAVSRSLGSFMPSTVSQRLRLTSNDYNLATAASLQRIFPAAGNLVQVEFTYNAYQGGSGGGDGIAVIFSDSTITPQPGAYGGSLGYAQKTGIAGFAGGWLGIGLDEYGNFSTNSEGRVGGPGFRQDSVAIRGSAGNAYRYLTGTASLTPGIDVGSTSTTPGPGHRYRISIDLRTAGKAWVTVERDVNGGSNYQTLIASYDVLQHAAQAPVPANLALSFTGSTGGARNIHELDDLQICAQQMLPVGLQIDHYEFVHAGNALTCNPLSVEVRACLNADCSQRHTDPVSVTLSPSGWEGGNSKTFSGGVVVDNLRVTTAQTVTLGVSNSNPPLKALSQTLCKVGAGALSTNCNVAFANSGLLVQAPDLLAGRPDTLTITAVRESDDSASCVPAFAGDRPVQLWSTYLDPDAMTQVGKHAVVVAGGDVSGSPTTLILSFNASGQASTTVRYDDAGLMQLNARFDGTGLETGLVMTGSDSFVSKPYGLYIATPADTTCTSADIDGCSVLRAAGDSFPLSIRAVAWQADGEERTAAELADNRITPNFRLADIALSVELVAPTPGEGGVAGAFYRHDASGTRTLLNSYDHALGEVTSLDVSQSEVGIFQITATPPLYHGQSIGGGESALIGRFTPAYLGVTSTASLIPACGAFSYQGQTINFASGQPQIVVTGYNRQGAVTKNYDREPFWNWPVTDPSRYPPTRQPYAFSDTSKPGLVDRLRSLGDAQSLAVVDSGGADGSRAFDWRADGVRQADALLWQLPSPPTTEDLPFVLTAAGAHVQLKLPAGQLSDLDGVCYRGSAGSAATCQDFVHAFGGTEVRLGRLRIDAASGPENQALDLPYWLESWQASAGGNAFGATTGDSCSLAALGDVVLSGFTGYLQASDFPAPPGTLAAPPASTPTPTGVIRLPAPNKKGSVLASLSGLNGATPALPWLLFDWDGNGTPEAPSARATFGVRALIFRREIYR